jgi:hypothetical protein
VSKIFFEAPRAKWAQYILCCLRKEQSMGEETEKKHGKLQEGDGQKLIEVTPLQLLAIMLKCALKDRITDEEIDTICSVYYKTINDRRA